jgi:hypothetical protein
MRVYETVREVVCESKGIRMDGCSPLRMILTVKLMLTNKPNYDGGSVLGRITTGMCRRDIRR